MKLTLMRVLSKEIQLLLYFCLSALEELSALMTKAVNLGFFKGYEILEVLLSHLQYVNETFLICEACVKNL